MKEGIPEFAAALSLLLVSPCLAAAEGTSGADLARRTYQNAEQLMHEGKTDQALKAYQQIIQSFPESDLVDDALFRVGSFHYPVESLGQLGSVAVSEQDAARAPFEQIRERHPQSDMAPRALYEIGLLCLEPDSPRRSLDEAYASFYGVVNLYPDSGWVPNALLGAAEAEMESRKYDAAILSLERALDGAPHGPVAAESYFLLGLANARLGDPVRAAEAFQACRFEGETGRTSARALDWITLIYKLRLRSASGAGVEYVHDPGFVPRLPQGEDLRGEISLAVSPAGELLVADSKRGALLVFAEDGSKVRSEPMEEIRRVAVDAFGKPILASGSDIRIGGESFPAGRKSGSNVKRIEDPVGVWRNSLKETFVLDAREGEVLKYGADPADAKVLHRDKDDGTRLELMAGGPEDRLFLLDTRQKQILLLEGEKVKVFKAADAPPALEEPVSMAVDALGDVFVADARQKAVYVMDPGGRKLGKLSPPAGSPAELSDPASIAVGPKGEVYVYDSRKRTVLRFR